MWRLFSCKKLEIRLWNCWEGFHYSNFKYVIGIDLGFIQIMIYKRR